MTNKTNWKKIQELSEDDIVSRAKSDPDNLPLTQVQLEKFKRVKPVKTINVKKVRQLLGVSQVKFAEYFGVSYRTIQEWEQQRKKPSGAARSLIKVILEEPEAVQRALSNDL